MNKQESAAYNKFPVQMGSLWQAGQHVIGQADHENPDAGDQFINDFGPFDAVFVDPPWRPADATFYRRKLNPHDTPDFDVLSQNIISLCKRATEGSVFVFIGKDRVRYFERLIKEQGGVHLDTYEVYYGSGSDRLSYIIHGTFGSSDLCYEGSPQGMSEREATRWCIEQSVPPGGVVFDPCMGLGTTAVVAHKCGRVAYGLELYPPRIARTLVKLQRLKCRPSCIR